MKIIAACLMLLLVAACAPIPTRTEAPLPSVVLNGPGLSILPVWIPNSATLAGAEPMSPAREYPASEVDAIIHSKGVEVIKPVNVALGEPFDGEIQRSFKSTTVIIKLRAVKLPCGSYDLSIHPTAVSHLKNGGPSMPICCICDRTPLTRSTFPFQILIRLDASSCLFGQMIERVQPEGTL